MFKESSYFRGKRLILAFFLMNFCSLQSFASTLLVYEDQGHQVEIVVSPDYIVTPYGEYDLRKNRVTIANQHSKTYSVISVSQAKAVAQKAQQIMDLMNMGASSTETHDNNGAENFVKVGTTTQYLHPCVKYKVSYKGPYKGTACFTKMSNLGLSTDEVKAIEYAASELESAFSFIPQVKMKGPGKIRYFDLGIPVALLDNKGRGLQLTAVKKLNKMRRYQIPRNYQRTEFPSIPGMSVF